jgi:hypothetical protein
VNKIELTDKIGIIYGRRYYFVWEWHNLKIC